MALEKTYGVNVELLDEQSAQTFDKIVDLFFAAIDTESATQLEDQYLLVDALSQVGAIDLFIEEEVPHLFDKEETE